MKTEDSFNSRKYLKTLIILKYDGSLRTALGSLQESELIDGRRVQNHSLALSIESEHGWSDGHAITNPDAQTPVHPNLHSSS
jgi:hypothetical protein